MLHKNGYKARDLAHEIDALLAEADPRRALYRRVRDAVDDIRHFGNFAAHATLDKGKLEVIDVEDHEAETCLETIEELFEHFYVGPAVGRVRRAALNEKLAAACKIVEMQNLIGPAVHPRRAYTRRLHSTLGRISNPVLTLWRRS